MSILNTFFLRYKADTGQAVKDINKLSATEDQAAAKHKKHTKDRQADAKALGEDFKKTEDAAKNFGNSLKELGASGNKLGALRGVASSLSDVVAGLGPAGMVAATGLGAVIGAIAIARQGIDDARVAAKEAIELGEKAFEARLSQTELIRMQSRGRAMGLSDDAVAQSAAGMQAKGSEIRAAQRQAARDPASAFNNPLIKQAGLWKKAGVDVSASLEKQTEQQNQYLRALQSAGEGERALIEGTQLFGRTLADVKAVVSTSQAEFDNRLLAMAKENELRRELQTNSEGLATAEQKLENTRKAADERVLSKTVPATKAFTEALDDWSRSTLGLKDMWGEFVAFMISGLTSIVESGTDFLRMVGLADETRTKEQQVEAAREEAGDQAVKGFMVTQGRYMSPSQRKPIEDKLRKEAGDKAAAEMDAKLTKENEERQVSMAGKSKDAAAELVKDGTFDGKKVDDAKMQEALKATEEAIKNDPNIKTLEDIKAILSDQLHTTEDQGKVQKAQTEYTKKIESNTLALVNTGLEQAMAMWAANVGAGSGVSAGGFRGETSGDYEARMRQAQKTINPNAARQMSMDRNAVGAMSSQADQLNKAKPSGKAGNSVGDVKIDKIEVVSNAADVSGVAKDFGNSLKDELRYAVAEFASPVVS